MLLSLEQVSEFAGILIASRHGKYDRNTLCWDRVGGMEIDVMLKLESFESHDKNETNMRIEIIRS